MSQTNKKGLTSKQLRKRYIQKKKDGRKPGATIRGGRPGKFVEPNEILGGRGTDTRTPANTVEGLRQALSLPIENRVLAVDATVNMKTITNMSLGIVLRALKHGLCSATLGAATNPYFMYRYLTDAFVQAMKGTVPSLQQAPRWLWLLVYAIKKKQVNFKTSSIQYNWVFTPSLVADTAPIPMGIATEAYSVYLSQSMSAVTVLGFPAIAPTVAPYTTDLGEAAIGQLWSFCVGSPFMTELIGDPGEKNYVANDSSAFSVVYPELGTSFGTPNAFKTTIYSERQIDSPLFAKLAEYQPIGTENWRGWQKAGAGGGSSCYIGPRLMELESLDEMRTKVPPSFKMYNFDEFFEVLSLTLAQASSAKMRPTTLNAEQCPLSSIEAQILFRQTIIGQFSNDMAQDLRFSDTSSTLMLPFTVGQNGVSFTTGMLLPTFIAENIRCCKKSVMKLRGGKRSIIDYVPVLGRPALKSQLGNYLVDEVTELYSNTNPPNYINLIDCSHVDNNTVYYLDFSRAQISVLAEKWNTWILTLATNLSPLVDVGTADGISVLKTMTYTNYEAIGAPLPQQLAPSLTQPKMQKQGSLKKIQLGNPVTRKMGARASPSPGSSYFDSVNDRFLLSCLSVGAPIYKVIGLWVLPVSFADPAFTDDLSMQGWAAFYVEPHKIPRSTAGGVGELPGDQATESTSVLDRHVKMAMVDVKGLAQDSQNELIDFVVKAGEEGRGGFLDIFTQLAGPVLKAITGG